MDMKEIRAKDIMSRDVIWVPETWPVSEAAKMFIEKRISGAPVVNEGSEMVGVLSLRDILQFQTGAEEESPESDSSEGLVDYYEQDWDEPLSANEEDWLQEELEEDVPVKDVMNPLVYCVDERTPIGDIAEMMLRGRIHRVVVTNDDELTGIVTSMDLIRVVRDYST